VERDRVDQVRADLVARGFHDLDRRMAVFLWLAPTGGQFGAPAYNHHVGTEIGIASGRVSYFLHALADADYLSFDSATGYFEMTARGRRAWSAIAGSHP
jgi:hypothetical protein